MTWTRLVPLGDQAALAEFAEADGALRFSTAVRQVNAPWLIDVVQSYSSVGVFFDPRQTNYAQVQSELSRIDVSQADATREPGRLRIIPCCYEIGPDIERVAEHRGISVQEVIQLHSGTEYTVYAIGFCPGFPFLGYLPEALSGVPRFQTPRVRVEEGSVGLTGRQTGIYTLPRPGGWHLVGRTPLQLVDVVDNYFPLRTGDRVRFEPINKNKFDELRGKRLGD